MRIRSLKPEFWRSDDVAALTLPDRLLFIGLWSYVDDSGIGVDKVAHIAPDLFAADLEKDPAEVFTRVTAGLDTLAGRGLIIRYEVDGRRYLYVTNWKSHQRIDKPSKRRYPFPPGGVEPVTSTDGESPESVATPSRDVPETPAPRAGEQGNEGAGEQPPKAALKRAVQLPASWQPNDTHAERARTDHLDLDREAMKFRTYVAEKGKTSKSWDATFTRWLMNAAEYAQRDRASRPAPPLGAAARRTANGVTLEQW